MALDPANGYPTTDPAIGAWAGDLKQQSMQFVLDIDTAMRANYATNIEIIGQRIFPMMYVESTFDGGRYTLLVDDDTRYVKQNVGPVYDICKAIAHIPLGIYSIIGGYIDDPRQGQWIPALTSYLEQVMLVRSNYFELDIAGTEAEEAGITIVLYMSDWMKKVIQQKTFTLDDYLKYCRFVTGSIVVCQQFAAKIQVDEMTATLKAWKAEIGEAQWKKLYVVISALWTLSQENAHEMIIKSTMSPDQQETNVIVSEAPQTLQDAQTLLGRILGDRVMAGYVFNNKGTLDEKENIYSLSTKRDLLSQAVEQVLASEGAAKASVAIACPHMVG